MNITKKSVQQLNSQKLFDMMLPMIDELYENIDYVEIEKEVFYKMVLKLIDKSKNSYNEDIDYIKYIKSKINLMMKEYIKQILLESKKTINVINNYINKYLKKSLIYDDSIINLKKLASFFETYNYIPNPDVLIEVIEDNLFFSKMIKSVMQKHKSEIVSGNLEKLFDNFTIILIIETYCMLNNIDIKEHEQLEIDTFESEIGEITDSIKIYLREIGMIPLLSREKERELAKRISEGDESARKLMIECNLKLVISVARKHMGRGLSFLDLVQEGNIGLMIAVDKYDVSRETKFSTYAYWWINQTIKRAIAEKSRNIRVPVHMYEKLGAYRKVVENLEMRFNRPPIISEIANEMGLSISDVTKLHKLQMDTISMNMLTGDAEDIELENFIPSLDETPEDIILSDDMKYQVKKLFESCNLSQREISVLILRYGFDGRKSMTLEEVGKKFGVGSEWIRQIESKAFMKIRRSRYIKIFADYMQNPNRCLQNIETYRERYRESGRCYKAFLKEKK